MSKILQIKRGNASVNDSYVGPVGEITVDTENWSLRVHDGEIAGGRVIRNSESSDVVGGILLKQDVNENTVGIYSTINNNDVILSPNINSNLIIRGFAGEYRVDYETEIPQYQVYSNGAPVIDELATPFGNLYYGGGNTLVYSNASASTVTVANAFFDLTANDLGNVNPTLDANGNVLVETVGVNDVIFYANGELISYFEPFDANTIQQVYSRSPIYDTAILPDGSIITTDLRYQIATNVTVYDGNTTVVMYGNIIPASNATANGGYSLGTQESQWKDLWVSNNTIYIGGTPVGVQVDNDGNPTLTVDSKPVATKTLIDTNVTLPNGAIITLEPNTVVANVFFGTDITMTGTASFGNLFADSIVLAETRSNNLVGINATITDTLTVSGNANIGSIVEIIGNNSGNLVTISSDTEIKSNLTVDKDLLVRGNLEVLGQVVSLNVTETKIDDLNITLANGVANASQANGAGYTIDGANVGMYYDSTTNTQVFTSKIHVVSNASLAGNVTANYFLGNGRFLDGIDTTLISNANSNVQVNEDGNITISTSFNDNVVVINQEGNITGNYIFGNGQFIEGLPAGYSDDDVGYFLPNYTGNLSAGNIIANGEIISNGRAYVQFVDIRGGNPSGSIGSLGFGGNIPYLYGTEGIVINTGDSETGPMWEFDANGDLAVPNYVMFKGNTYIGDEPGSGSPTFRIVAPLTYGVTIETDSDISGNNWTWTFGVDGDLIAPGNINANYINITNGITAGNIDSVGNVTANYFLGNGRFLDGIDTTLISNIDSNVRVNEDGNITISTSFNDNVVVINQEGNISGNYIFGNGQFIEGLAAGYSDDDVGYFLPNYTGNLSAGNVIIAGNLTVTGEQTVLNIVDLIVDDYNITIANGIADSLLADGSGITIGSNIYSVTYVDNTESLEFSNSVSILGNIYASNATVAANTLNVSGNITAGRFFYGNGRFIDGIDKSQIFVSDTFVRVGQDANVVIRTTQRDGVIVNTGNVITLTNTGNIHSNYIFGNIAFAEGNEGYNNDDVALFLPNYTGNVRSGNLTVQSTLQVNGTIVNNTFDTVNARSRWIAFRVYEVDETDYTGSNIAQASVLIGANLSTTQAVAVDYFAGVYEITTSGSYRLLTNYVDGSVVYNESTDNWLRWTGTLWTDATYGDSDVDDHLLANGLVSTGNIFGRRGVFSESVTGEAITSNANLTVGGNVIVVANVSGDVITGNTIVGTDYTLTGLMSGSGEISVDGNVTGGNVLGVGVYANSYYQWTIDDNTGEYFAYAIGDRFNQIDVEFGNRTYDRLSHYANNDLRDGTISSTELKIHANGSMEFTSNSTGSVFFANDSATWGVGGNILTVRGAMGTTGDMGTSGNLVVNRNIFGNIRNTTGGYNDANVLVYLGANTDPTILSINGSIRDNAANIVVLQNQVYGNANVAEYLPYNEANVRAGNVTVDANVDIYGNLFVQGTTTYNNTSQLTVTDKVIIVANGAISAPAANGAGISVEFVNASITYSSVEQSWKVTNGLEVFGVVEAPTLDANLIDSNVGTIHGNLTAGNLIANAGVYSDTLSLTGNATVNYYFGNGALLDGVNYYTNSNVADFLATYTGDMSAGNLQISGNTFVVGNLQVTGTTTTVNQTALEVQNKTVTLSSGAANPQSADDSGIVVDFVNASILWDQGTDEWRANRGFTVTSGNITSPDRVFAESIRANSNIRSLGSIVAVGNLTAGNVITANIISDTTNLLRTDLANTQAELTANTLTLDTFITNVNLTLSNSITVVSDRLDANTQTLSNLIANNTANVETIVGNVYAHQTHIIYKVSTIDTTNYQGFGLSLDDVTNLYQVTLTSNAAVALDTFNQLVEIRTDNTHVVLKDYFPGLTIISNDDDLRYKWTGTEWELNINERLRNSILLGGGFTLLTKGNVSGNITTYNGNIVGESDRDYYWNSNTRSWQTDTNDPSANVIISF